MAVTLMPLNTHAAHVDNLDVYLFAASDRRLSFKSPQRCTRRCEVSLYNVRGEGGSSSGTCAGSGVGARRCGGWLSFASVFAWGLPFGQRLYSDGQSPSPGLAVLSALRASLGFRLQRGISHWLNRHSLRGWRSVSRGSRLLSGLGRNCSLRVFHL